MKNNGFTLVEILVTIIIVGLMAAVAVPKVVSNLKVARAAEAYNTLGAVARQAQICLQRHAYTAFMDSSDNPLCSTWADLTSNGLAPSSTSFTYALTPDAPEFLDIDATLIGGAANDNIRAVVYVDHVDLVPTGIFTKTQ